MVKNRRVFFYGLFSTTAKQELICYPPLKLTASSPLKKDGLETILSCQVSAYFQGLWLLVSGRVIFLGEEYIESNLFHETSGHAGWMFFLNFTEIRLD